VKLSAALTVIAVSAMLAGGASLIGDALAHDEAPPSTITVPDDPFVTTTTHARDREQINECHVTREGMRPGEYESEFWQSFRCADGYEFTLVWGQATIRNTFGNALREDQP